MKKLVSIIWTTLHMICTSVVLVPVSQLQYVAVRALDRSSIIGLWLVKFYEWIRFCIIPYDLWEVGVEIFHMDCTIWTKKNWIGIKDKTRKERHHLTLSINHVSLHRCTCLCTLISSSKLWPTHASCGVRDLVSSSLGSGARVIVVFGGAFGVLPCWRCIDVHLKHRLVFGSLSI